jgi:Activator of Hsp90 ATPase homolog 1-like protein
MRRSLPPMSTQVFIEAWPEDAFGSFVEEAGFGLRSPGWSWIQPERGRYLRFNRDAVGRFVEAYDAVADTGEELGRVTAWEPGAHLTFGWRQADWPEGASTEVDVRFIPVFDGTLLSIEHAGFERLRRNPERVRGEYLAAWTEAASWVARRGAPRASTRRGVWSPRRGSPDRWSTDAFRDRRDAPKRPGRPSGLRQSGGEADRVGHERHAKHQRSRGVPPVAEIGEQASGARASSTNGSK